jgi:hypothetical protein
LPNARLFPAPGIAEAASSSIVSRVTPFRRAFFLASALAAVPGANAALWVSPAGDDSGPGTEEQPLRTIERARDVVRTLNANMSDDISVFISGSYRLAQPVVFGPQDSGTNGFSVVYTAAPGEHPVLSGGLAVTGWALSDGARNLWSAPAPEGLSDTRDLFVNGSPAERTRIRLTHSEPESQADAATPDPWALWKNPADVELVNSVPDAIWSERAGPPPYYGENALEILSTPGQWYFDRAARRIYYMPRAGENLAAADVIAAGATSLITGAGTAEHPLAGLIFKGIRFEFTTAAGSSAPAAAVRLAGAGNIQFLEDEFVHMGTPALDLGPGLEGATVEGCLFGDIAWSAVRISRSEHVRVASSRLSYISTGDPARAAIEVVQSADIAVEHCEADHFPSAAISAVECRPGAVQDILNTAAPVLATDWSGPPAAGSGVPPDFQDLLEERLTPLAAPHAPSNVAAEARDKSAIVTWDPPCLDGGGAVGSFEVASSAGARLTVGAGDFRAKGYVEFPGLENGTAVAFTVTARNPVGSSPPSVACAPVVPGRRRHQKPPSPPVLVTLTAGESGVSIAITPPASSGGSSIVSYALDVLPAGAHLELEGRDVIHADADHPLTRGVQGFAPASGSDIAVSATNATGTGKAIVVRWP